MTQDDRARADVLIVGSGVGGATVARALAGRGLDVLVLERGGFLPQEPENADVNEVFSRGRYKTKEHWLDGADRPFTPAAHYGVGGNSKVYGAALLRFREDDFAEVDLGCGTSPAWPITYGDLEGAYSRVESWFRVHGSDGADPTGPPRSVGYPFPAIPHAPGIARLVESLRAQGLRPLDLPLAVDHREGGACRLCATCDGFPCQYGAKWDAETACLLPALDGGDVRLWAGTRVEKVLTTADGSRVTGVQARRNGAPLTIEADRVVLACGAVNTALTLLRSGDTDAGGLANSSGLVGRNYMQHLNSAIMAIGPRRQSLDIFQKTVALTDVYRAGDRHGRSLGSAQLLGKLQPEMLAADRPRVPRALLRFAAQHSIDWFATTEDLPDPRNRVSLTADGTTRIRYEGVNRDNHRALVRFVGRAMRRAGFPLVFSRAMSLADNSHQCGTARMGDDPATSVVDSYGRCHDVAGLVIADASVFVSSAAVNPALTVAATALRSAEQLARDLEGPPGTA